MEIWPLVAGLIAINCLPHLQKLPAIIRTFNNLLRKPIVKQVQQLIIRYYRGILQHIGLHCRITSLPSVQLYINLGQHTSLVDVQLGNSKRTIARAFRDTIHHCPSRYMSSGYLCQPDLPLPSDNDIHPVCDCNQQIKCGSTCLLVPSLTYLADTLAKPKRPHKHAPYNGSTVKLSRMALPRGKSTILNKFQH